MLTYAYAVYRNQLWAVTSAVGAVLCFLVLVVIAAMFTTRESRVHLDRVSFRLMLYSLIAKSVNVGPALLALISDFVVVVWSLGSSTPSAGH